jgi:iron-sulfur cluster repair protein YtfE (RIC family)
MDTITAYLDQDHRRCDEQYALAVASVAGGDWERAGSDFATFLAMFHLHLEREERVLFPRLDRAMGNAYGPTAVMRAEHGHMRGILEDMRDAIACRDAGEFFDLADALRVLMGQHNLKEESILYPQADRVLQQHAAAIVADMRELGQAVEEHLA